MMKAGNVNQAARNFAELFSRFEYALKRSGHLAKGREHAEADWGSFAKELGPDFYRAVVDSGVAPTLINDPPRKLLRDDLAWGPRRPAPIRNVEELFAIGVCRVRNSYVHGEKFVGGPDRQWERDAILVNEALQVLQLALSQTGLIKDGATRRGRGPGRRS